MRRFIDGARDTGVSLDRVLGDAALFIGVAVGHQVLDVLSTYVGQRVGWQATNALREDLTLHCLRLDMPFHNRHMPGEMIERVDGDVGILASFLSQFAVQIVGSLLMLAGTLVVFAAVDWRLGAAMALYAACTLLLLWRVHNVAIPRWRQAREASAELFGFLEERLGATVDIRALGATPHVLRRLFHFTRNRLRRELAAVLTTLQVRYVDLGSYALGQILTVLGGYYLYKEAGASVGTVAMLIYYTDLLHRPLRELMERVEEMQRAGASVARVRELLDERPSITAGHPGSLPSGPLAVQFEDVTFAYAQEPVLDHVSFEVPAGRTLGLLGPTGSGKSTIARLLGRLYDPQSGTVRLAGQDLSAVDADTVRRRIAVVPQNGQLLTASVRDNVTLFDASIGDDAVEVAIRDAGMGHWLDRLPTGLETQLRGDAEGLSAGETQLLTVARALLRDPGLVILDEASSRLDPSTEAQIDRAVTRLLRGRTAIVIAHRLATVQRVDDILILQRGRIEEWGARQALAADPVSRYSQLLQVGTTGDLS